MTKSNYIQQAKRAILWLAIEDFCGLWEVLWQLNSSLPCLAHDERFALGRSIVSDMLSTGLVAAFEAVEPYEKLIPLPLDRALEACKEDMLWSEPGRGSRTVRIGATKLGESFYQEITNGG